MITPGDFSCKRVLVTGGLGFIGSNLVRRLLADGAKIAVIDSLDPTCGSNPRNLSDVRGEFEFHEADLVGAGGLLDEVITRSDVVFHLAGRGNHQDSMNEPLVDMDLNARATLAVIESVRKWNPDAITVFASTRQIYGAPAYLPVDEEHPLLPVDVNGIHKQAAEQYLALYYRVYGLRTVSLRLTNAYGPRQQIRNARQGVLGWLINRALTDETLELFGGGSQIRDFHHVEDVVEAFRLAALNPACYGHSFNLSGECASLLEIAEALVRITGKGKILKKPFPEQQKKIDIGDYYGTSERFKEACGWAPEIHLKEGLTSTVSFFEAELEHYLGETR